MARVNWKVQGATLVETLIAVTILVLCFTMATMIVVNMTRSGNRHERLSAYLLLQKIATDTKRSGDFSESTTTFEQITIGKKIVPTDYSTRIIRLDLIAKDKNNRPIGAYHELILLENETLSGY